MSKRLPEGGLLIDRNKPIKFEFNGKKLSGFEGDTLASALLSNDQVLVGRSFKYHRPRGIVASGSEEPNALGSSEPEATIPLGRWYLKDLPTKTWSFDNSAEAKVSPSKPDNFLPLNSNLIGLFRSINRPPSGNLLLIEISYEI